MSIKGTINLTGSEPVTVDYLEFDAVNESNWVECKLEDGNVIAIKSVITKIIKSPNKDPITGDPVYYVMTSQVIRVVPKQGE